jgi:hypothetical protein
MIAQGITEELGDTDLDHLANQRDGALLALLQPKSPADLLP